MSEAANLTFVSCLIHHMDMAASKQFQLINN